MSSRIILAILLFSITSCANHSLQKDTGDKYFHLVKYKGESLALIAGWYTGDVENWKQLAKINKIQDPTKIEVGQTLLIPKSMLSSYEPLPISIVNKKAPFSKTATVKIKKKINNSRASLNFEHKLRQLEKEKSLGLTKIKK